MSEAAERRREEMLREMGISPIWRLRTPEPVAVEEQVPASSARIAAEPAPRAFTSSPACA